jgi:tetratricopeptide (TPR) repeat protein
VIKEKPLFGYGPATYRDIFPQYRKGVRSARLLAIHPHNEYLEMGMEYGLIGLGLFALAWAWGLLRLFLFALKTPNSHHAFMAMAFLGTAAGTLVHSMFDFQMHIFPNAWLFALLAALAAGPFCGRKQEQLASGSRPPILRNILRIFLLLLTLTATAFAVKVGGSAYFRARASRLVFYRQPEAAEPLFNRAIKWDKRNWAAYKEMGLLYAKKRYYSLNPMEKQQFGWIERGYLSAFYQQNPYDAQGVAAYGQILIFLGDEAEGLKMLRRATHLRPFNDLYWWRLGVALRKAGDYQAALDVFEQARKIRNTPSIRANIRFLQRQLKSSGK